MPDVCDRRQHRSNIEPKDLVANEADRHDLVCRARIPRSCRCPALSHMVIYAQCASNLGRRRSVYSHMVSIADGSRL